MHRKFQICYSVRAKFHENWQLLGLQHTYLTNSHGHRLEGITVSPQLLRNLDLCCGNFALCAWPLLDPLTILILSKKLFNLTIDPHVSCLRKGRWGGPKSSRYKQLNCSARIVVCFGWPLDGHEARIHLLVSKHLGPRGWTGHELSNFGLEACPIRCYSIPRLNIMLRIMKNVDALKACFLQPLGPQVGNVRSSKYNSIL